MMALAATRLSNWTLNTPRAVPPHSSALPHLPLSEAYISSVRCPYREADNSWFTYYRVHAEFNCCMYLYERSRVASGPALFSCLSKTCEITHWWNLFTESCFAAIEQSTRLRVFGLGLLVHANVISADRCKLVWSVVTSIYFMHNYIRILFDYY